MDSTSGAFNFLHPSSWSLRLGACHPYQLKIGTHPIPIKITLVNDSLRPGLTSYKPKTYDSQNIELRLYCTWCLPIPLEFFLPKESSIKQISIYKQNQSFHNQRTKENTFSNYLPEVSLQGPHDFVAQACLLPLWHYWASESLLPIQQREYKIPVLNMYIKQGLKYN